MKGLLNEKKKKSGGNARNHLNKQLLKLLVSLACTHACDCICHVWQRYYSITSAGQ